MPSETPAPALADPPGWRIGHLLSARNGICVHAAEAPNGQAAILKRLDLGIDDPIARLRFEREQRLAQILRHPGLAMCWESGEGWLGFEALAGSLTAHESRERAALILRSLARTLAYLHGRGVAHQDVKPAHVLFDDSGRVVLIDLGSAGLMSGDPLVGHEAVGAPAWAAPEQWDGASPAPAADLWSLARLALWLLGEREPGRLAQPLGGLVQRCLAPDPKARPSAAEFAETLEQAASIAAGVRPL